MEEAAAEVEAEEAEVSAEVEEVEEAGAVEAVEAVGAVGAAEAEAAEEIRTSLSIPPSSHEMHLMRALLQSP